MELQRIMFNELLDNPVHLYVLYNNNFPVNLCCRTVYSVGLHVNNVGQFIPPEFISFSNWKRSERFPLEDSRQCWCILAAEMG